MKAEDGDQHEGRSGSLHGTIGTAVTANSPIGAARVHTFVKEEEEKDIN